MKLPSFNQICIAAALLVGAAVVRADVLIVAAAGDDAVFRVNSAMSKTAIVNMGLTTPEQAIYDSAGNLFIADSGLNKVIEYPAGGGAPVEFTVNGANALALDADGVVYAASSTDRTIQKLTAGMFSVVATLPVGHAPRAVAVDSNGDIYVADDVGNRIYRVAAGSSTPVEFSSDVTTPYAVAFDAAGRLNASDSQSGGRITRFKGSGSGNIGNNSQTVVSGLTGIRGLAFDRAGDAYFLNAAGELRKVSNNTSTLVIASLGDPRLLTARAASMQFVAYKGQQTLVPSSTSFTKMGSPAIGGSFIAFKGTLLAGIGGVDSTNSLGIWRVDEAGIFELLARKGVVAPTGGAPGLPNDKLIAFGDPVLNESGKVAFIGTLKAGLAGGTATSANAIRVFSDVNAASTLKPVLSKGDPAPGSAADPLDANVKFTGFRQLVLPDDSGPALLATIAGPGVTIANNLGLWSADTNGTFALLARKGQSVTFPDKSRKLTSLGLFKATPLSLGQGRNFALSRKFVFLGKFSDGYQALLLAEPGMPLTVLNAKAGVVNNADPEIAGAKFGTFGSPCVSDSATVYGFFSKLLPGFGPVITSTTATVFRTDATDLVEGRVGYPAPVPAVTTPVFASVKDPVVNASGGVALLGKLKVGTSFPGVTLSTSSILCQDLNGDGQPSLVARQGDLAPDVSGNVKFTAFKQYVLPDTGGVVFTATIAGSGITTANNLGVWADDGAGSISLLLRKGDKLKLPIGNQIHTITVRGINIFKASVGVTGQSRHFNSAGVVACQITGLDGSAPFQAILRFVRP